MRRLPHFLCGSSALQWARLGARHAGSFAPRYWGRALEISGSAAAVTLPAAWERVVYGSRVRRTSIDPPPIFILGHWRTGTTLLHSLLALDHEQLAAPSNWEVFNPNTLLTVPRAPRWLDRLVPGTRPQDNMKLTLDAPQEEEFALCVTCGLSPYAALAFPKCEQHYARYLSFEGVEDHLRERWKRHYLNFARKLTLKHGRRLVFKSPPNTARIRLLSQMFPGARFVHVVRDPYRVYQSSRHLFDTLVVQYFLQDTATDQVESSILERGRQLYCAYLDQRTTLAPEQLLEIYYDELVRDPLATIRALYRHFDLTYSRDYAARLRKELAEHRSYEVNAYSELDPALARRIRTEWAMVFDHWDFA